MRAQLAEAHAEGGRATQTEQGREAKRTRADALRDKFWELQVRLAEVETEGDGLTLERMRSPYARLAGVPRREGKTQSAVLPVTSLSGRFASSHRADRGLSRL